MIKIWELVKVESELNMIEIVNFRIESSQVLDQVTSVLGGAMVLFLGTTRQFTADRETARLEYECYHELAIKQLQRLRNQAIADWNLEGCAIVHRIGVVPIGEASVAIAVSSAHRRPAFEAAEWLIDRMKQEVPIWKQEYFADGTTEWIHPQ
jgi:molybdopterin synthase catalytic subunit